MKHCKRILTLVLMLALVLALSLTAQATEADSSASDLVTVFADANGGNFADGLTEHEYTLDLDDPDCLDELEVPYRDGHFFVGWMDNWDNLIEDPDDLQYMYGDTLYAKWQASDDPTPLKAEVIVSTEDENYPYSIWGYDTYSSIWLESEYADAQIVMNVTHPNGKEESWPITLDENGKYTKSMTITSYDGTASLKYLLEVFLEQPRTEPEDLYICMYVGENSVDYSPLAIGENNIIEVVMSGNYGIASYYQFEYYDVNDEWYYEQLTPAADGTVTHSFTSANGQTYTLKVSQNKPSSNVTFEMDVWFTDNDDSWWSDYYNCEDFVDNQITFNMPYGTVTDADGDNDNALYLYLYPSYGTFPGFTEDEYGNLRMELTLTPGKDIVKSFTAIAPDGVTKHTYTVTVKEAAADNVELSYIEVYGEDKELYFYEVVDLNQAATAAGATVQIPYSFANDTVEVYAGSSTGATVSGPSEDGNVELEADGTTTVKIKATSPNGKKTQIYTVNLVKDMKGDTLEAEFYIHWRNYELYGPLHEGYLYADMAAAATEAGAVLYLDDAIHQDPSCIQFALVEAEDYGRITYYSKDMAGNKTEETWHATCMTMPYEDDEDQAVYLFTVTSPNGKHSQDYKVTVVYCDDHTYVNGKCSKCGAEGEEIPQFNIGYANMTLGNSLAMNFAFAQDSVEDWTGTYARITKVYADGREDKILNVPYENWSTVKIGGKAHWLVAFPGVAAKEMSDAVYVTICAADGTAISHTWEDSVRSYAMRLLNNPSTGLETQIMAVDLLNYGAAAQENFQYNTGDLANNQLSAAQKALATKTATAKDSRKTQGNYLGTNLGLESQILMRMAFTGTNANMTAKIEFTNHAGRKISVDVPGSEFGKSGVIVIDEIVIADGRMPITVTVYNADGSVYASATDSLESYIARMSNAGALYEMILKFSDSAYNFFH